MKREPLVSSPGESDTERLDNQSLISDPEDIDHSLGMAMTLKLNHASVLPKKVADQKTIVDFDLDESSRDGITPVKALHLEPKAAVLVRDAVKRYGSGPIVLNKLSMTVQQGTIYGLLGSSGCGKTSILSCIVGIRKLNSGEILVYGANPGTMESGIPGRTVGYMPQDISLYGDFSIREILVYFGTIYTMTKFEIEKKIKFLIHLLHIPGEGRRISSLSGGQKRRLSLAVSLIHSPRLLILDEPTVGVDPLLRQSIWNHLVKLVSNRKTTVIITTHYIEEARQSGCVGLMRNGRLLEEKNPEKLLQEYETSYLEDIVLELCLRDDKNQKNNDDNTSKISEADTETCSGSIAEETSVVGESSEVTYSFRKMAPARLSQKAKLSGKPSWRIRALIHKNVIVMTRNYVLLIFMIFVPACQVFVVCTAIGNDPKPMNFGVVNYEMGGTNCSEINIPKKDCMTQNTSCLYMDTLPSDIVKLKNYKTIQEARSSVEEGEIWGYFIFYKNFTEFLPPLVELERTFNPGVNLSDIQQSRIIVQMDESSKQIAVHLRKIMIETYLSFLEIFMRNCGMETNSLDYPINYLDPVYGNKDTDFREYIAPSILIGLAFFFPLCTSGVSYIWDKKQGTLERAKVAGVLTNEIMIAFFVTEGIILLIQSAFSFAIIVYVFEIEIQGSLLLAVSLTVFAGLGGVSMGFLLASFCTEEIEAVMIAMASFFPNFLLSGMIWPTEGMPLAVQYASFLLPGTLAAEAMRSIVSRGWGFTHWRVWPGFAAAFGWICVYWLITLSIHRFVLRKQ